MHMHVFTSKSVVDMDYSFLGMSGYSVIFICRTWTLPKPFPLKTQEIVNRLNLRTFIMASAHRKDVDAPVKVDAPGGRVRAEEVEAEAEGEEKRKEEAIVAQREERRQAKAAAKSKSDGRGPPGGGRWRASND